MRYPIIQATMKQNLNIIYIYTKYDNEISNE